jgi:cytidylate kinase
LKIAADAVRIDSTAVDIDEVVRKIVADVRARGF